MPQYLYVLRALRPAMLAEGPSEDERATLTRHFAYLQEAAARGEVLLFGRTQTTTPDTMGLVLLRAPDDDAARDLMNADPAVIGRVMSAELFPYEIAGMAEPAAFGAE